MPGFFHQKDSLVSTLFSPNALDYVSAANNLITIKGLVVNANDDTRNRLELNSTHSKLISPDGTDYATLTNNLFRIQALAIHIADDNRDRLILNTGTSALKSPSGAYEFVSTDSALILLSGATTRLTVDSTKTELWSPNTTNTLSVNNTNTQILGPVGISGSTLITNLLTVQGTAGFNAASETAQIDVGDTQNYVKSTWGEYIEVNGVWGVQLKRGSVVHVQATATETEMWNPQGTASVRHSANRVDYVGLIPVRLPRMTTAERNAITAAVGDTIFNTITNKMECYDGSVWQPAW